MNLEEARQKIDSIDKELIKLFEERMKAVCDVAKYKKEKYVKILKKVSE